MKKVTLIIGVVVFSMLIVGCAPKAVEKAENMNNASIGMSKQQVISAMGKPQSVSAKNGTEYLNYKLCTRDGNFWNDWRCRRWDEFYVRLTNGKVDSYGKLGDFDSTKVPETKKTIDLNVKHK